MGQKSLRHIRKDLEQARGRVDLLIGVLKENEAEPRWGLGEECAKSAENLRCLLKDNEVPREYKVAVIGRFKAGKSSFVNELLGMRLAGEDTNPETAAITAFRAAERVIARIKLIDKETWGGLKALYEKDTTDPEAHRIANWSKFAKAGANQGEPFDLETIELQHLKAGGHVLTIPMPLTASEARGKAESEFRRQLRQYTSSAKPYHCLVESIEIETPSAILSDGVVLVDTPGLDDTERFRVQLTEKAVQDVDAILFLTKSGESYGQSEKDFLLSVLRRGTVKHLVFVVTQVDHTYEQHVRQSRDQDENPEPVAVRIETERRRIRREIETTLDELAGDADTGPTARYREQMNAVEIAFTSVANHRDEMHNEPVKFPIKQGDPGGMHEVEATLFRILSTESRIAETKRAIEVGAVSALESMLSIIEKRRLVVGGLRNREVAEQKLATFRAEFEEDGERFAEVTRKDCAVLKTTLENRAENESLVAEIILLQAGEVLGSYETDDAGRHWRTRRGGYWGYMHELQTRVANRIFPKVAGELNKQINAFSDFVDGFRVQLQRLSDRASAIIARLEIGDELQLNVRASLEDFLGETLGSLQEMMQVEETKIVRLLENFVDEQVKKKITAARERVTGIWGVGTTTGQTTEVRRFYDEVRAILRDALCTHVRSRFDRFRMYLNARAVALPEKSLSQVRVQIERASNDIRAAAEAAIADQKEAFERTAVALVKEISTAQADISVLLADETGPMSSAESENLREQPRPEIPIGGQTIAAESPTDDIVGITEGRTVDTPSSPIRGQAISCVERYILRNGAKGWPLTRIFAPKYLRGASEGWLTDPYLALRHQRRNLTEFVMAMLEGAKLKRLHIITRETTKGLPDYDKTFYETLDRDAFEKAGMRVEYAVEEDIHDRSFVLDNGFVFKLGRGLDIYKPVAGLASRDTGLRQVRSGEIDVFGSDGA